MIIQKLLSMLNITRSIKNQLHCVHKKECPAEAIISKAEKGILQKKKARLANVLSVKDLEKLDENELKLLPAKDFWDSKKKQWKKNVYGTFAKRNSVKMKIFLSINDS